MNKYLTTTAMALCVGLSSFAAQAQMRGERPDRGERSERPRAERVIERMKERCERIDARLADMNKNLSTEQVRDIVAGRLAQSGEANLKVGKVQAKDGGIVAVEIVTQDGSLVTTREISTKTGLPAQAGERCDKMVERIEKARETRDERGPGPRGRLGVGPGAMTGLLGAGPDRDLNLTADQAKKLAEATLIMGGNPRLKVGAVKEKDADTYVVDIVTVDNSLVTRREIDKHTGRPSRMAK
ncbi:MAG: hypothetical protein SFV19_01325 [Rhodospirillaceae bacterium]|nr:hypothetical protein [Rhodospirillaceae bacterium]